MAKQDRTKERENKRAEREMDNPDMSGVVPVPTRRPQPIKTLAGLAGVGFKGFNTIPDSEPGGDPYEPTHNDPEDHDQDTAVQELFDQIKFGGNAGEENDAMITHAPITQADPDMPDISELRDLHADAEKSKAKRLAQMKAEQERQERMHANAPEILDYLFAKILPELTTARSEDDQETVQSLEKLIQRARKNDEVATELDRREQQREVVEASRKREAEMATARTLQDEIGTLYANLPDDPDAEPYPGGKPRKLNSPTKAIEATQKVGDTAMLVIRIPAGTVVPTAKGGFMATTVNGAVQLRITVDKVEGAGDDRHIFRKALVTKETAELHFRGVKAHLNANPGEFNFVPPYFTRKEENERRNDPFDAIKYGVYLPHNREYNARRQEERFSEAVSGASLTATELLLNKAVGSASIQADWVVSIPSGGRGAPKREFDRHLKVVLKRDEENGPLHVVAWGPPPGDKFSPRLNSLQPRRDSVVPLTVEARVEEKEGGVTTAFVRFSTKDATLMAGDDDRSRNVREALRDLNMCLRQALLAEAASAEENPGELEGLTDEEGKSHRHSWRKDDTCRCGEKKPELASVVAQ